MAGGRYPAWERVRGRVLDLEYYSPIHGRVGGEERRKGLVCGCVLAIVSDGYSAKTRSNRP